jgi:hypothetical protein
LVAAFVCDNHLEVISRNFKRSSTVSFEVKIKTLKRAAAVQPADAFYAIGSGRADAFYQSEIDPADWEKLKNSFLSHIYDSGSRQTVPSGSLYARLARKYCPVSYRMATNENYVDVF